MELEGEKTRLGSEEKMAMYIYKKTEALNLKKNSKAVNETRTMK